MRRSFATLATLASLFVATHAGAFSGADFGDTSANPGNTFAAAASFSSCPDAGVHVVTVDGDAPIDSYFSNSNYGTSQSADFVGAQRLFNGQMEIGRSLFHFPLPSVPAGCTVTAARLVLQGPSAISVKPGLSIAVYRAASTWDETTVTWANRPAVTGQPAVAVVPALPELVTRWDVLDLVHDLYAGPNNGFVAELTDENSAPGFTFFQQRFFFGQPQLEVTLG